MLFAANSMIFTDQINIRSNFQLLFLYFPSYPEYYSTHSGCNQQTVIGLLQTRMLWTFIFQALVMIEYIIYILYVIYNNVLIIIFFRPEVSLFTYVTDRTNFHGNKLKMCAKKNSWIHIRYIIFNWTMLIWRNMEQLYILKK